MKTALVLEGGSLRCMFSCGVADVLMEMGIVFDAIFGVSAGSLTGVNIVSNQPGRTMRVNVNFASDKRFIGLLPLMKTRSVFNFPYLFSEISDIYLPLDRTVFFNSPVEFTCCVTSCETGQPIYISKESPVFYDALTAGSSMPLFSPIVDVGGIPCLDGGVSVAIPYQQAINAGYEKIIVIPTREHGYRKPMVSRAIANLYIRKYAQYPNFVKALIHTPVMYAKNMSEIDRLTSQKRVFPIWPEQPIQISRTEKDPVKLLELYYEGRRTAEKQFDQIVSYLNEF